jgi:hypothetical protein
MKLVIAALLCASCVVGDEPDPDTSLDDTTRAGRAPTTIYKRVVLGRLYQTSHWMLPAADTYRPDLPDVVDRRIAYVCDAIAPLKPTYVSGLIRLSWDTPITDEMQRIFRGFKQCIRARVTAHPVKFDVVLNAKHYTEPRKEAETPEDGVASPEEGRDRLYERMRTGNDAFDPDIWFFDFYSQPFNDNSTNWHKRALADGITRIHGGNRLVGGNVWGYQVPPGSDFAAIPLIGGVEGNEDKIAKLQAQKPTLMHIRNDPQVCDSEGLEWFTYGPQRRGDMIANVAAKQATVNAAYMYPAFFPLSATADCAPPGVKQFAYDAKADGILGRLGTIMDREAYRPR